MHIWVTRTAPDNFLTARRLQDMGHRVLLLPTLAVTPLAHASMDFTPAAILFTSANGVRHHRMQPEFAHVPVYAVGNHASELALRAGYRTVTSTGGDAELVKALMSLAMPNQSRIVHYSAREVAPELPRHIVAEGHEYAHVIAYEVEDALDPRATGALPDVSGIVVHSARGAMPAAALVRQRRWRGTVWVLSKACAEPFDDIPGIRVAVADTPAEHALLALIPGIDREVSGVRGSNNALLKALDNQGASNDP